MLNTGVIDVQMSEITRGLSLVYYIVTKVVKVTKTVTVTRTEVAVGCKVPCAVYLQ